MSPSDQRRHSAGSVAAPVRARNAPVETASEDDLSSALFEYAAATALKTPLTPRELEILQLLAEGQTNEEIAAIHGVSPQTVKSHTHSVFLKLKAQNRAHAVALGFRHGLIS